MPIQAHIAIFLMTAILRLFAEYAANTEPFTIKKVLSALKITSVLFLLIEFIGWNIYWYLYSI